MTLMHGSSSSLTSWNIEWARRCSICHSCSSCTSVMQQSRPFGLSRQAYSDRNPVLMILRRQFLALKCGSGKQTKIFSSEALGKYWQMCLMVLVLTTAMLSNLPGSWIRYPRIFSPTKLTSLSRISIPRTSLSWNSGASPKSSPPNPHPMSITLTCLSPSSQSLGLSYRLGCSIVLHETLWFYSSGRPKRAGQCARQSTQV